MSIDLDSLIAQRAEATGVQGNLSSFDFTARAGEHKGEKMTFTYKDPVFLTDDEVDELEDIELGPDLCCWYMGETEYERFLAAGGSSNFWAMVLNEHNKQSREVATDGRPTRPNRYSRRHQRR